MPYIGNNHIAGDHTNNFKVLDDISSYTATFDGSATSVVDTTNNTIRVVEHRFIQGQRVTYTNGGGGNIGGLTTGTAYFVIFDSASTIKLATNASNAANSTAINLSAVGSGSSHTLNAAFDGVNTKFKLTHGSGTGARLNNATQINVAINNVLQRPNLDPNNFTDGFALEDNHKIVFQTAPTSEDIFWGSIIANTLTTFDISDHKIDTFTGDGSTTEFTLSHTPANNESLMVTINGVLQHPSNASTARAYTLIASIIQFTAAPGVGDEIQVRHLGFAGATTADVSGFYGRTGNVVLTSNDHITTGNINAGIVTATSFDGTFSSSVGGSNANFTGIVTAGVFKGGDFDGRNLNISGIATFAGDVSIGGTLTYEDVTNIDSVGIITAQKDIHVGAGISAVGVITGRYLNPSSVSTQNVIIGWESSARNVTGSWNVLLGRRAGEGLTSGGSAVCIGANAGQLLGGSSGVFIGGQAGSKVTGAGNVFIGGNAGQQTTSAGACTIIGTYAGIDNQGSNNTIVGNYAGRGNSGVTDGAQNTFIGAASGFKIQGGDDNTGLGYNSLRELLGGNKNVAIGRNAGNALVSGNNNIIIGYDADASTSTTSNEITLGDANINHLRIPGIGVSFDSTGGTQLGIITATGADINGDLDVDGHTNLDNVSVAGISTAVRYDVNFVNAEIKLTTNQSSFSRYGRINHYHNNGTTEHNAIQFSPRNGATGRMMFYNMVSGTVTERLRIDGNDGIQPLAHIIPMTDSTYNLGSNGTRFANVYADTLYGDGSNLTGITQTTINNNAANRIITGSGTANTLNGNSDLLWNGSRLDIDTGGTEDALRIGNTAGTDTFIRLGSIATSADTHAVLKYDKDDNYVSLLVSGESHGNGGILIANGGAVSLSAGTSPLAKLHVKEDIYVKGSTGDGSTGIQIRSGTSALSNQHQVRTGGGLGNMLILEASGSTGIFQVQTGNGGERFRITSGGHVNIGGNYTQTSKTLYVDGTIEATSNLTCLNNVSISGVAPQIIFTDTNQDSDYTIKNDFGSLQFIDRTNSNAVRMYASTGGFGGDRLYIADEIVHTGDTDTKIAFTDNQIDLQCAGASRAYVNNYGLYIQAGFPLAFLASSGASPNIKSGGTNNQDLLFTTGTGNPTRLKIESDGGTIISNAGSFPTSTSELLTLQGEGHNGHGTTNTRSVFNVTAAMTSRPGNGGGGLWIGARTNEDTAVIGTRTANGNLAFETYNGGWSEKMRIRSDGKVLMGAGLPTSGYTNSYLHVEGPGVDLRTDYDTDDNQGLSPHLTLVGSNAHVRLDMGVQDVGPYASYLQSRYDNDPEESGTSNSGLEPLMLNPMGGAVGFNITTTTSYSSNNFSSSQSTYGGILMRAGRANTATVNNTNTAIKIYPAETRTATVGEQNQGVKYGGIAWHGLDPHHNNGSWSSYTGHHCWMGMSYHSTPGQEKSNWQVQMNNSETPGSFATNVAIQANPQGYVTHPNQPYASTTLGNATSGNYVPHNTVLTNNGSHFNTSNSRFICPVNGFYLVSFMAMTNNSNDTMDIELRKNGSNANNILVPYQSNTGSNYNQVSGTCIIECSKNDYLQFRVNNGSIYSGRHSAQCFALLG